MNRTLAVSLLSLLLSGILPAQDKQRSLKPDADQTRVFAPVTQGIPGIITRAPSDAALTYLLNENFAGSFPPAGWTVINPDSDRTWVRHSAGGGSARMNFYDYVPNEGQVDSLLTPLVTGLLATDSLSFSYAYCAFPGTLVGPDTVEVYLSTDGGATFPHLITTLSTADSTAPTNINGWSPSASQWGWRSYLLPPGSAGGSVRVLFVAHNHYAQNFYLDNVRLGTRPANDVGTASIDIPDDGGFVIENASFTPGATFINSGSSDQLVPFTVNFQVLDTAGVVLYTSSRFLSPLNSGASQAVSFDPMGSGIAPGTYGTRAFTSLASDENTANDTLVGSFVAEVRIAALPYSENFDGASDAGWSGRIVSGSKNDWVRGTPSKPIQLRAAHSGASAWVTNLDTTYSTSENAALYSPFFDLSGASTKTTLEFYHNFRMEPAFDGAVLEYSTNLGSNWHRVDTTLGQGPDFMTVKSRRWYNSASTFGPLTPPKWSDSSTAYASNDSGWIRTTTSLGKFAGQPNVRFRWRFRTDNSEVDEGWAIDDIAIYEDSLRAVTVTTVPGWQMISVPVGTSDSLAQIFPCMAYFYRYEPGVGYPQWWGPVPMGEGLWGKGVALCTASVEGTARDTLTVPVTTGWNLVGGPSFPVDVSTITSNPPGIIAGGWYGFESGYVQSARLIPGKSYWVKAAATGTVFMQGQVPARRTGEDQIPDIKNQK